MYDLVNPGGTARQPKRARGLPVRRRQHRLRKLAARGRLARRIVTEA